MKNGKLSRQSETFVVGLFPMDTNRKLNSQNGNMV